MEEMMTTSERVVALAAFFPVRRKKPRKSMLRPG
jgi:hypothetical protein